MESLIRKFVTAVREETSILNSLVKIGEEKHRLIILNKVRELDTLVQKEGIMVSALQRTEDARFKLQQELANLWTLPVGQLTLTVFIEKIRATRLSILPEAEEALDDLKSAVKKLQQVNRQNRELTDYALEYVDYLWTLLEGDGTGVYSERGAEAEDKPYRAHKVFDRKV